MTMTTGAHSFCCRAVGHFNRRRDMTRSIVPHVTTRPSGRPHRPTPLMLGTLGLLAVGTMLSSQTAFARGEQAGVSAAVRGEVELAEAKGVVGTQIESGQPIYLGDYIRSSAGSGMQILLMDETVFTIGPNSEIAIDDFVYDPSNNQGHMTASITRGVVRVLTGKLAHNDPKTMKINLPVGSIGIRGTQFLVSVENGPGPNGTGGGSNWSPQTQQFAQNQLGGQTPTGPIVGVVNLGPGADRNDSGSRPGAVELTSLNGVTQPLSSEGFGAFITGETVTPPTRFPTELAGLDMSALVTRPSPQNRNNNGGGNGNGGGGNGNGGGGGNGNSSSSTSSNSGSGNGSGQSGQARQSSSSNASGQNGSSSGGRQAAALNSNTMASANNQTGQTVAQVLNVAVNQGNVTSQTSDTSNETAQQNNDVHSDPEITNPGTTIEAATYDAMRDISSGYYVGGTYVQGANLGYYSMTTVDFGSRQIESSFSQITETQGSQLQLIIPDQETYEMIMQKSYTDNTSGQLVFTNEDFTYISQGCLNIGCTGKVIFKTPTDVEVELSTNNVSDAVKGAYGLTDVEDDNYLDAITYEQLGQIETGFYTGSGLTSAQGMSFNSYTAVDFGSREIFTELFNITDTAGADGYMSASKTFTNNSDYAVLTGDDFNIPSGNNCETMGCDATVAFTSPTTVQVNLTTNAAPDGAQLTYGIIEDKGDPGPAPDPDPPIQQNP
ncbi:hypothetical protein COO20_01080 [Thalassospira marina]|uniref:FecR protein domain-containing protein n=2 Tax=Thalassospira marina TaxID=2048283 RepID=A0A2N3KZ56_9PROT|nr:hypothetical protein COO20_01080 [Thalassospira marina]